MMYTDSVCIRTRIRHHHSPSQNVNNLLLPANFRNEQRDVALRLPDARLLRCLHDRIFILLESVVLLLDPVQRPDSRDTRL